jgi:glycosyltransferase involved in cell wall biosynthesis
MNENSPPLLSIIVPCLNEEGDICNLLDTLVRTLARSEVHYEIVVIDDQSTDSTFTLVSAWKADNPNVTIRLHYKEMCRRGYGAVIKYGLAYSDGDFVVFVSADLVDPINLIPKMYAALLGPIDLVQVSRYLDPSDNITIPFIYKFYQFFYRVGAKIALGRSVRDSTYAFKMFKRRKIMAMGLSSNRFSISPEIYFKSTLANLKISIIPGSQGIRINGVSKFSFTKESLGFGLCLVRAWLHRKGYVFWF